ncbi:MAG: hypothetical protein JW738_06400, partial [Actinobacteria bacterium]|nr:hypothetical protein [Actinomycetota bacterium]
SAGELAVKLGLNPADWRREEYRDCPVCRLRDEIMSEQNCENDGTTSDRGARGKLDTFIWITVGVMAAVILLFWLFAVW